MSEKDHLDIQPEADVAALELEIGVRSGFFRELLDTDDDWSFVIKVHALVEAAVSHLLAEVSGQPDLLDFFSQLELSNPRTGKIAFAKALECLDSAERRTLRKLSELRNQLVHDVSNVDFDLENWASSLDPNQANQFAAAFGLGQDSIQIADREVSFVEFFRDNPRITIWFGCFFLLSFIYQRKDLATSERQLDLRKRRLADRLIRGELFGPH